MATNPNNFSIPKCSSPHAFDVFHKKQICDIPPTGEKYIDPMDRMRPKRTRAKEYSLDQKYALIDRGDVKVRYTETEGLYEWYPEGYIHREPVPKPRPESGRGPLTELLDDTWKKVVEGQQLQAHLLQKTKRARLKKKERAKTYRGQQYILGIIGPDWFQELSNKQLQAVDGLAESIQQDLKTHSFSKTKESLSLLGLVFRSRPWRIKLALDSCCASPVEFLLILYHIIDPKRTSYSLNDRLILSAVVHLTLTDTLRELHIRIPSPPREPIPPPPIRKVLQRKPCISPYLDTFIYIPPERKINWSKPPREYPRSEYFSYLTALRRNTVMLNATSGCVVSMNNMQRRKGMDHTKKQFLYEEFGECEGETREDTDDITSEDSPCNYFTHIERQLANEWELAQTVYNKLAKDRVIPALHKASVYFPCFNGLTQVERPPVTHVEVYDYDILAEEIEESTSTSSKIETRQLLVEPVADVEEALEECVTCDTDHTVVILPAQNFEPQMKFNTVTCQDEEINEIDDDAEEQYKYNVGKTLQVKEASSMECHCKEMLLKRLEESRCTCEECKEDLRLANLKKTLMITDTSLRKDEKPVQIIAGVKSEKLCTCLEKYEAMWEKYEKRLEVKKAQQKLKSVDAKFIITGTSVGSDGKVIYILGGVSTEQKCECYKIPQYEEEEKIRLALMPKAPDGCIKYMISGVQARPEGNVYILGGTAPNNDCRCMEYFEKFAGNHLRCIDLFREYMKKVHYDTTEYFRHLSSDYTNFVAIAEPDKDEEVEEPVDDICSCECIYDNSSVKCELNTEPSLKVHEEEDVETNIGNSKFENASSTISYGSCHCSDLSYDEVGVCEEEIAVEEPKLERYIILHKFPCKLREQMQLLKKALDKLADDGFPLAKLPDAYRLPHFRLWLQLRCGKYWTQEDKDKLHYMNKAKWNGTKPRLRVPRNTFLEGQKEKQHWGYCKHIRANNNALRSKLYLGLKTRNINYGREFYCTTNSYEFGNKTLKDAFFSYLPPVVDGINPMKMWLHHEYFNYSVARNKRRKGLV